MSLSSPYLVLMMRLSVLPSTSTTLHVVRAPMVHVSTSLLRSWHGSTRRTPRKPHQYIGSPDWLVWERPRLRIRSANCLRMLACHSPPFSAHSSSTAGTPSSLSLICAATSPNSMIRMRPMFCRPWKETRRLPMPASAPKSMNCLPSHGRSSWLSELTMIHRHP